MLKEISIQKETIMIVMEYEVKDYMDYMAMKRCNDHTQPWFQYKLKHWQT
jgi:hypothetical protein